MDKIGIAVVVAFGTALIICFLTILGTVLGAFSGWLVGLVFPETLSQVGSTLFGFNEPWQLGAALGFVGAFFRSIQTVNTNKKDKARF